MRFSRELESWNRIPLGRWLRNHGGHASEHIVATYEVMEESDRGMAGDRER